MKEYVILVAGGTGSRMKSEIPKQFIEVNGLPVLMHTVKAFRQYSAMLSLIIVLPADQFAFWDQLCSRHSFREDYQLVPGGETRFHSVKNGLSRVPDTDDALIAVHDGVRPVISREIIKNGFLKAAEYGTSVASVALKDSIRLVDKEGNNSSADRNAFRLIQTPQTFRADWMRKAFDQPYHPGFTDCASVMESSGHSITLIEGSYENIKITTPEDLNWAQTYLAKDIA
jgi:2-C-methyl-D-erythritol 4-phosphate cytidylyltransferase